MKTRKVYVLLGKDSDYDSFCIYEKVFASHESILEYAKRLDFCYFNNINSVTYGDPYIDIENYNGEEVIFVKRPYKVNLVNAKRTDFIEYLFRVIEEIVEFGE